MGLVAFPFTAISTGTEYTEPATTGQGQALCIGLIQDRLKVRYSKWSR